MKHPRITLLAGALALAGTATAASATVVYRDVYVEPAVVRVEPVTTREVVSRDDGTLTYRTYERSHVVEPRYVEPYQTVIVEEDPVVVSAPRYYRPYSYDPNPQMGQLIDHGLFNRRGPNDFGR